MASKRWEKMVEMQDSIISGFISSDRVVKLLARQHRAFVRMVKKYDDPTDQYSERAKVVHDILAALAMHRKGRT